MIQVRNSVFETNSSSVHSLTMCTAQEYDKWRSGELLYNHYAGVDQKDFITREEAEEIIRENRRQWAPDIVDYPIIDEAFFDAGLYTWDDFWNERCEYLEGYSARYITPGGEEIVAFGYSGYDS